jgi:exopolyphosphatase/guanosine-5'-triphosphate,3'-diphosphate pyrophosphatase
MLAAMTAARRLATIDLGTNTVRLLVVDAASKGTWTTIDHDQRVTRVGEGLTATGRLGDAPMERTLSVVAEYVERARRAGAAVRIIATSAVREAANGAAFAAMVERRTGAAVRVVSGEDEARLTVLGILRGLDAARAGALLAFDIGGGSTEFTLARDGAVERAVSLRLGVVPLAERFPFPGRVDPLRYRALEDGVRAQLARELPEAIRSARVPHLVGTAGTVTTLAALDLGLTRYDATRVQGHRLSRAAIEGLLARLGALGVAERAALPCLEPGRADLIVPGTAIVLASLDVLALDAVLVSDWGLREGIIADAIEAI